MSTTIPAISPPPDLSPDARLLSLQSLARAAMPVMAALLLFSLFLAFQGFDPLAVYGTMIQGAFGTGFGWQNTLSRTAPIILTALGTLIPAYLGLVVIGNEGAFLLGGLALAGLGPAFGLFPPGLGLILGVLSSMLVGGLWLASLGWARQRHGIDPTITSLLLYYVAWGLFLFLVEGPFRDPASLNKPSTFPLGQNLQLGTLPVLGTHIGIILGPLACLAVWLVFRHTRWGFHARLTGGNERLAATLGLPRMRLMVLGCALAGAFCGLAGSLEVSAVHRSATASLNAGLGTSGILVAFLARQHPLAVIPVAVLVGGLQASGGLVQRRFDLPDATITVFQGFIFLAVLLMESYRLGDPKAAWLNKKGSKRSTV